jgi:hypothetical protein
LLSYLGWLAGGDFFGLRFKTRFFGLISVLAFLLRNSMSCGYLKNILDGDTLYGKSYFHKFSQKYVDMWPWPVIYWDMEKYYYKAKKISLFYKKC